MSLTRVSPALFATSNNITSVTVGGSANTISLTFDGSGVITSATNNAISVANTAITGNIISSQITSVANTQISGNIASSQITSNPTLYGNVSVTGVIGVGGATPSTSGSGITFPASQSASSNANTLDDYEEGTFTPTISGNGSSPNQVCSGTYTKTGRYVFCTARVVVGASSTMSEWNGITGLPFTAENIAVGIAGGGGGRESGQTGHWWYFNVDSNATTGSGANYVNSNTADYRYAWFLTFSYLTA